MDTTALGLRTIASNFAPAGEASLAARFRRAFEGVAIGIGICDLNGRIEEANPALARSLGYERGELVGVDVGIDPWRLGENRSERIDSAARESSYAHGIGELLRRETEPFVLEKRWQRRDGSEFWGRLTTSVAGDDRGEPANLVVLLEDASKQRQVEEQLRQAEKMAAIGQLSGGVAHDFNNLLTGILLYCDLLIPELELGGPLHRYVEEIRLATEQGAALTRQLLALARKEGLKESAFEINDVVGLMGNLLRRLIGGQIDLITTLGPGVGTVVADPMQLRQIVLNLVLNARDAVGRGKVAGGKIRVSTSLAEWPRGAKCDPATKAAKKKRAAAERVYDVNGNDAAASSDLHDRPLAALLTVEDNGCGMSVETRGHLFEPFFTTKEAGAGTGLGLGTVLRIVGELGGAVEITSNVGSGTRVEVFLPVAGDTVGRDSECQDCRTSKVGDSGSQVERREE
ncbi:MAG: ATP-binding protein [Terriglobales bacterium]